MVCVDLSRWLPQLQQQEQVMSPIYDVSAHFHNCYFRLVNWAKPVIILETGTAKPTAGVRPRGAGSGGAAV